MSSQSSTREDKASYRVTSQTTYDVFRNWIWELASIAVAVGLIVCIAVLLAIYDGKPTPNWGERINFNALLAILSTILRAMLVVVVSQVISQRKWEWFGEKQRRPLSDLQKFDSGSRGSLGAIRLLPTVLWKDPITWTAGIILFASFLVGPSIQQASRTTSCTIVAPGLKASMPFAHYVPRRGGSVPPYTGSLQSIPSPDLTAAVLSVITAPEGEENRIHGSCSTGNCTFLNGDPTQRENGSADGVDLITHSTVAMCNRCTDVTSLIQKNETQDSYRWYYLPNNATIISKGNYAVAQTKPSLDLAWMGSLLTPEMRAASRWAYVNATVITYTKSPAPAAVVCSLYPCLRTYTSSIRNNEVFENNTQSFHMQLEADGAGWEYLSANGALVNQGWSYTAVKSPCRVDDEIYESTNMSSYVGGTNLALVDFTDYDESEHHRSMTRNVTAPEQCIYRQNPSFVKVLSTLLNNDIFDGSCAFYKTLSCSKNKPEGQEWQPTSYSSDLGVGSVVQALHNNGYNQGVSNITRWFDKFADTMTNRYRSDYGAAVDNKTFSTHEKLDLPLEEAHGQAWQTSTCVSIRRSWLLLPIGLTIVTTLLAAWTIATNWRYRHSKPVWKDSILPFLFYARDIVNQHHLDAVSRGDSSNEPTPDVGEDSERHKLLETRAMEKLSRDTKVTLRQLYGNGTTTSS